MFPCSRPHCPTCPFANFINVFNDLNSSVSCSICYNLSCASSSVIYIIECSLCHERYVGQARRSLRDRIKQHLRTLRAPSHSSLLQDNFNVCGLTNFSFSAISHHHNDKSRLAKEASWIRTLRTLHSRDLNTVSHSEPEPNTLVLPFRSCAMRVADAVRNWCRQIPVRVSFRRTKSLIEHLSRRNV